MDNVFTFREDLWPRPRGGPGYDEHKITLPVHPWWEMIWTTWDYSWMENDDQRPERWSSLETLVTEVFSLSETDWEADNLEADNLEADNLEADASEPEEPWADIGTSTLWLRFKSEALGGSYFDLIGSNRLDEIRSDLHSFLKDLAEEIKQLARPAMHSDLRKICEIGLRLDYLIPPSRYIGDLAIQLFETFYLEELLNFLPAYGLFTRIGANTTSLSSTQYYSWIQRLLASSWMAPRFTLHIYAPLPSNLESLLQTVEATGQVHDLFVDYYDLDSIPKSVRDQLLQIASGSTLDVYPLRETLRIDNLWRAVIDNRDALLSDNTLWF